MQDKGITFSQVNYAMMHNCKKQVNVLMGLKRLNLGWMKNGNLLYRKCSFHMGIFRILTCEKLKGYL